MASDPTQPGGRDDGVLRARQPDLLGPEEDADIPPSPRAGDGDPLDSRSEERLQRMSRRNRALPSLLVLLAIGAFAAIVWWAYNAADDGQSPSEIPVVEAEPGEEKVRPESEGGMEVPNRDKLIYQQLGSGETETEVERLLPPPEEPLDPPAPPPVEDPAMPETAALTPPPPPQEIQPSEALQDEIAAAEQGEPAPAPAEAPDVAPADESSTETAAVEAPAAEPAPEQPEPATEPAAEAAPPQPAEPVVADAAGGFRVQLAAVKNEAGAEAEWSRLQKAHPDLLGGLQPTIQRADLGDQGVFFRIQGGPLSSRDAAAGICDRLKQQGQACIVVAP